MEIINKDKTSTKIERGCKVYSKHSLHVFTVYDVLYTGPGVISYLILDYPGPHGGRARVLPDGYSFYAQDESKQEESKEVDKSIIGIPVKVDICAKAEALSFSSDTRAAGKEMKKLSAEWKSTGRVLGEDMLWARFKAAKLKLTERIKQEKRII